MANTKQNQKSKSSGSTTKGSSPMDGAKQRTPGRNGGTSNTSVKSGKSNKAKDEGLDLEDTGSEDEE